MKGPDGNKLNTTILKECPGVEAYQKVKYGRTKIT